MNDVTARTKAAARQLGFDAVGICDLRPVARSALDDWLAGRYHGAMRYMEHQAARRRSPASIVPGATRAVVVLKSYFQGGDEPPADCGGAARGLVARYAWGADYHEILGERLDALVASLIELGATPDHTRWYIDAGPVPERELAQRAGLGWIAKNTMLIAPGLGSFTFIGAVLTDLPLRTDSPFEPDRCGTCRRCLDACPTDAFPGERVLDATQCISYLTIEHRGVFDTRQADLLGDWLFGCDVCQGVCPWNERFAKETDEPAFAARPGIVEHDLHELAALDRTTFERRFRGTALQRAGWQGIKRNAEALCGTRRGARSDTEGG